MLPQTGPPQLDKIIAAKNARRRELAALPWEDKIDIVQRMWSLKQEPEKVPARQKSSWQDVCALFAKLLEDRIKANASLTEDSLRYTFFLALVRTGFCDHAQISLEERHPSLIRQRISAQHIPKKNKWLGIALPRGQRFSGEL